VNPQAGKLLCRKDLIWQVSEGPLRVQRHLTPAQWLPKSATSQCPHKSCSLRELWSPKHSFGGEGEVE